MELGRNEYMMFTEIELEQIEEILNGFSTIAKKMGIDIISTGITLTTDKEAIELSYIGREEKKCNYYKKSVVESWNNTLNNIKADLFEELKRICQ